MAETTTYDLKIKFNGTGFVSNDSDCYVETDDNEKYIDHGGTFSDISSGSNIYLQPRPVFDSRYRAPFKIDSDNNDIDGASFSKSYEFVLEEDTTITFSATKYNTPYISFSSIEEESFTFTIKDIDDYDEYLSYDIIDSDMNTIASGSNIDVEDKNSYSKTIKNLNPNSTYRIYFSVYDYNDENEYGTYDDVSTKTAPKPTVNISTITATTAKITLTSKGSYFVSATITVAPEGYTSSQTVTLGSSGTSNTITITRLQPVSDYTVYVFLYNSTNIEKGITTADFETTMIDLPILQVNYKNNTTELTTPFSVNLWITNQNNAIDNAKLSINASGVPDQEIEIPSTDDTIGPFIFENLNYGTNYTITAKYGGEYLEESSILTNSISFQTLNAYTINVNLNNLNHIYVSTKDMEDVYISHGETFLVIPGETFTVSFPNNTENKSAFTNYDQTHNEGKKTTYYWPYGFPVKAEGIGDTETSRIPDDPGEASYLVGTAATENGKTYTFTAYPSGWTGWTDSEKPKAKEKTTTFSVESWNKLVNCLDAWNAFCGKSAVSDTFMPQNGSYNFTATIYNKIYDELTGLFNISSSYPIMSRVEKGKERQTSVSASGLINIGNNIKYDQLKSNHK